MCRCGGVRACPRECWCSRAPAVRTHGAPGWPEAPRSVPRPAPPAACLCSVLQEQKSELRKRLSYTTHRLQKLESEFGSTRSYLEVELRRAQEELEKVTLKLRRSGYGTRGVRVGLGRSGRAYRSAARRSAASRSLWKTGESRVQ